MATQLHKLTAEPRAQTAGTAPDRDRQPAGEVDVLDYYRAQLSPQQYAWLTRGAGVICGVATGFCPGRVEDYEVDASDDR